MTRIKSKKTNFKNNIQMEFQRFKLFLIDFFSKLKLLLLNSKKQKMLFVIFMLASSLSLVSSLSLSSLMSNNISQSFVNLTSKYKEEKDSTPNTLLYYKNFHIQAAVYNQNNNNLQDLRTKFEKTYLFNMYAANWQQLYSPGIIEYGANQKDVSFLAWPRSQMFSDEFLYDIPFVALSKNTALSINDIYITDTYADEVLKTRGYSSYSQLIEDEESLIKIPYRTSRRDSQGSIVRNIVEDNFYKIRGIIDTKSVEYQKYFEIFGEFFIVNDCFTLPIPFQLFFELSNSDESNLLLVDELLKRYKADVDLKFDSTIVSNPFQCRLAMFGDLNESLNITNVTLDDDLDFYNQNAIKIFNCQKQNGDSFEIVYILWLAVNVLIMSAFIIYLFTKNNNCEIVYFDTVSLLLLLFVVSTTMLLTLYISGLIAFGIMYGLTPYLNGVNHLIFVMFAIYIFIISFILCITLSLKHKKSNRSHIKRKSVNL